MAATSAALLSLLNCRADINTLTFNLTEINAIYEGNAEKLDKQTKYQDSWVKEYDKAKDGTRTSDLKMNGNVFIAKETEASDAQAEAWANYKVKHFDEELLNELSDLDIEYETLKTMYEAQLEIKRAEEESLKTLVSEDAQETGLLNAG